MEAIEKYKTHRAQETEQLDELVNAAIADGFQLYGNPYSAGPWLCQAVVGRKKPDGKPIGFQTERG
jgi:hypothetical protein